MTLSRVVGSGTTEDAVRITEYKVVETSTVTDEALTRVLNDMTKQGWIYDGMSFVPNEASKRPRMAFVIFTRERDVDDAPSPSRSDAARDVPEQG